ncbi:MAG: hypothetical protein H0U68_19735, partial [Ramlibacter sp.]|nr:hypothetical protein [Ramlibacter sp.]
MSIDSPFFQQADFRLPSEAATGVSIIGTSAAPVAHDGTRLRTIRRKGHRMHVLDTTAAAGAPALQVQRLRHGPGAVDLGPADAH